MGGSSVAGCWAGNLAASAGTWRAGLGWCGHPGDAQQCRDPNPQRGEGPGAVTRGWRAWGVLSGSGLGTRAGLSVGTLGTLSALGCAWEPRRGLRPRVLGAGGQEGSPCPGRWGRAQGTAGHGAGQGAERGPGAPRPPPPAPRPAPAAAAACQGWRGGGGGGRRGKDGGRSARVMLHAHSPSPPESPTRRAPSSPSAVPGCRRGGCSEGPRPRAALSPGPPPAAGGRPAGPEPPGPGRRGSAEA